MQAAKLQGEHPPYIMFAEILPNVTGPIIVEDHAAPGTPGVHRRDARLPRYGPQPPSPDWGLQIAEQYADISLAWWAVIFPALAIASLVVAISLVADAVQQVLDEWALSQSAPPPLPLSRFVTLEIVYRVHGAGPRGRGGSH